MTEIKLDLVDPRVQIRALQLAAERLGSTPLQGASQILTALRDAIEEQVKPAIEEPTEFGSIVRARFPHQPVGSDLFLWQHAPIHGKYYWENEHGAVEVWSELTDVEVLRVGVGEATYEQGWEACRSKLRTRFIQLASSAITSERKDAWRQALEALS